MSQISQLHFTQRINITTRHENFSHLKGQSQGARTCEKQKFSNFTIIMLLSFHSLENPFESVQKYVFESANKAMKCRVSCDFFFYIVKSINSLLQCTSIEQQYFTLIRQFEVHVQNLVISFRISLIIFLLFCPAHVFDMHKWYLNSHLLSLLCAFHIDVGWEKIS